MRRPPPAQTPDRPPTQADRRRSIITPRAFAALPTPLSRAQADQPRKHGETAANQRADAKREARLWNASPRWTSEMACAVPPHPLIDR